MPLGSKVRDLWLGWEFISIHPMARSGASLKSNRWGELSSE